MIQRKDEMDTISKPWDWNQNTLKLWREPAEEAYYLIARWKKANFREFLDLGCGLGRHAYLFAENGFSVNAFDLSEEAVQEVREGAANRHLDITTSFGDMMKLPYPDGCFDCVLAYHVISHTDSLGIGKILEEIRRVLKPGGEFFLTLCSKTAWIYQNSGYPRLDENTVISQEEGPEHGVPHFCCDEILLKELFAKDQVINLRHTQDWAIFGREFHNSWHYFLLGKRV